MTTCITCGAEITSDQHTCADPLAGFDADRDGFEPTRDEPVEVDELVARRWRRAADRDELSCLDRPGALDG